MNPPETVRTSQYRNLTLALQHRDFRLLWIGQVISIAGSEMQNVTINWHIYTLTNSAVALGLVGLVRVVPIIAFSLIGGVFADAHDRRRVLLVTQSSLMLLAAALALVTMTGMATVPIIYLIAGFSAAAGAFDSPARQAIVPNLVPREHLTNALSLTNMMWRIGSIAGPALAGFVIAGLGIHVVYWINALSFLGVIIALLMMRTPAQQRVSTTPVSLPALAEGVHYVLRSKIILATMLLDFFATFFSSASALLPIFAQDILRVGPEGLGFLYSAESVGALVAGVAVASLRTIKRQGIVLLWSVAFYGLATMLFGVSPSFLLSFLFLALVGASDMVSTILRNTIRQVATPDHLRGRMTAVNMIFFAGGPQLGNLEAGVLAALIGAPLSVVTGGVATVLFVIATAWLIPQLRAYQD